MVSFQRLLFLVALVLSVFLANISMQLSLQDYVSLLVVDHNIDYNEKNHSLLVQAKTLDRKDATTNSSSNGEESSSSSKSSSSSSSIVGSSNQQQQRLVIFAGPGKSGSTSVETFFFQHMYRDRHHALANWTWPVYGKNLPWIHKKEIDAMQLTFAVLQFSEESFKASVLKRIAREFHNKTGAVNVLLAAESLSREANFQYLEDIASLHLTRKTEIVLNYRTPRVDQLVALFRQVLPALSDPSYRSYLCDTVKRFPVPIEKPVALHFMQDILNPLGVAQRFLNRGWHVTVLDMSGVHRDGLDVCHVIACEVLRVPCTDKGWMEGFQERDYSKIENHRTGGDPMLTERQKRDIEWLFRKRDCLYAAGLEDAEQRGQLRILHRDSMLADCHDDDGDDDDKLLFAALRNATRIVQLLRAQIGGCGGNDELVQYTNSSLIESWRAKLSAKS